MGYPLLNYNQRFFFNNFLVKNLLKRNYIFYNFLPIY